jgi:hypothetical protein
MLLAAAWAAGRPHFMPSPSSSDSLLLAWQGLPLLSVLLPPPPREETLLACCRRRLAASRAAGANRPSLAQRDRTRPSRQS